MTILKIPFLITDPDFQMFPGTALMLCCPEDPSPE